MGTENYAKIMLLQQCYLDEGWFNHFLIDDPHHRDTKLYKKLHSLVKSRPNYPKDHLFMDEADLNKIT